MIPNLFIVGAPKAGSTFLYQNLKSHPELYFTKIKELNFFSHSSIIESKSYYKDYRVKSLEKYLTFYEDAKAQKFLTDVSVSYFAYPDVANKIHAFNPNAKIIISLRNPISRAFSHYLMDKRMGYASNSFLDYIKDDAKRTHHFHQYIGNSLYYKCVMNYIKVFGEENVLILILEEMDVEMSRVYKFLGIKPDAIDIDTTQKLNSNKKPKNKLAKLIQKNRSLTSKLKMIIPYSFASKLKFLLYKEADNELISEGELLRVKELILNDTLKLQEYMNRNLIELWDLK
jgi:hypothetical protein